jgi:L,D-transpeptidase YcbB
MLKRTTAILMLAMTGVATAGSLSDADRQTALTAMSRAGDDGLDPSRYVADPKDAVSVRVALLSYMHDLEVGRPELQSLDADVALPPGNFDAAAALDASQRDLGSLLAGLAPPLPEYTRLKAALARYRAIAGQGDWPILTPDADPRQIRTRLAFEDGAAEVSDTGEALKHFQARHGVSADGKLGPATLAALNVPASARADTIAANMERWRWLPRTLEPDRIVINVADAKLELFLNGQSTLVSRVVVGKPATPTPILRAEGAGITINPPWTVPASIAAREILPKLKRNPAWLASQDMILLDGPPGDPQGLHVDWRAIRAGTFPYRVRQQPGAKNSLGLIKIELPNRFDVYLHDTPGKSAFTAPSRDVSHGCVRVEQILPLASYALAGDLSATSRITDAIATGQTSYLALQRKLPVYFLYWTAFADPDGAMEFRSDIYGRDQRMIAAVTGPPRFAGGPVRCPKA